MFPRSLLVAGSLTLPIALAAIAPATARATVPFQQVFLDQYLADHADRDFVQHLRRDVKCCLCHQPGSDRAKHNAYGYELAKRLDAKADRKDFEKILAALRAVANLPADASQPSGPTFGERIAASQPPAAEVEALERESK